MSQAFENADFYDYTNDREVLYTTVDYALEDAVGACRQPGESILDTLYREKTFTIYAFNRKQITTEEDRRITDWLLDQLIEFYNDSLELGDPNGVHEMFTLREIEAIRQHLHRAVKQASNFATVWSCEEVASKTFTAKEVIDLLELEKL